ncbi:hypothetical protein GGR56DRAFT_672726 [Xylariaceae sp. FL0804]|nr:hypothetical protein GGR56DRAFT_672726 [Xylariaceae sp. FL0804]
MAATSFLASLDLLSVSSLAPSSPSIANSADTAHGTNPRAHPSAARDPLCFYLSSSTLPSIVDLLSEGPTPSQLSDLGLAWTSPTMPHVATLSDVSSDRPKAITLRSTADYHNSLLDQQRRLQTPDPSPRQQEADETPTRRPWLSLPNNKRSRTQASASGEVAFGVKKAQKLERIGPGPSQVVGEVVPGSPLTRQDVEEFEALPIAVRRKYFSTLERLRFAQTSGKLDRRRDERRTQAPKDGTTLRPTTSPGGRLDPAVWTEPLTILNLAKLPAKIREKHLTREEQLLVAKQLRKSVILDAADEAIYRAGHPPERQPSPQVYTPSLSSSPRASMESLPSQKPLPGQHEAQSSFYDSFRWLDEDDGLDLRLALDDFHADLKEAKPLPVPAPPPSAHRRRFSVSRMSLKRPSLSLSRPPTRDSALSPSPTNNAPLVRRRSRALSLISSKHAVQSSVTSIDPTAAHYQDPEARLKLRVYLASPSKFDEAIEFGFPSNNFQAGGQTTEAGLRFRRSRGRLSIDSEKSKTFLADDQSSIYSEDLSVPDPDSPRTPDKLSPPPLDTQLSVDQNAHHRVASSESYLQAPACSREMTLRMTLTRPDLRGHEEQQFGGWSFASAQSAQSAQQSQMASLRAPSSARPSYAKQSTKESMDRLFADIDQELAMPSNNGMVKRLWNRVRRN